MNILQISDIHLGVALKSLPEKIAKHLHNLTWQMICELPTLIKRHQIDILIVAGDLYDHQRIDPKWFYRMEQTFNLLLEQGIIVVYATGNHDYFIADGQFANLVIRDNFILFNKPEVETKFVRYGAHNIAFHGIGYNVQQPKRSADIIFNYAVQDSYNIGVFHGNIKLNLSMFCDDYYNVSASHINSLDYDLFACGHVHNTNEISPRIQYAGSLVPTGKSDIGNKFALIHSLDHGLIKTQKIKLIDVDWKTEHLSIQSNDHQIIFQRISNIVLKHQANQQTIIVLEVELRCKRDESEPLINLIKHICDQFSNLVYLRFSFDYLIEENNNFELLKRDFGRLFENYVGQYDLANSQMLSPEVFYDKLTSDQKSIEDALYRWLRRVLDEV